VTTKRPLAALALIGVISAGCGSTAPAGSSGSASTARAQAVKFAECLRANGVRDFPDPNAKGDFDYGVSVTPARTRSTASPSSTRIASRPQRRRAA
jgi:hypothetical protein